MISLKLYGRLILKKEGKGSVSDTQKKKLYDIGLDEMLRSIERYKKAKTNTEKQEFVKFEYLVSNKEIDIQLYLRCTRYINGSSLG